MVGREKKSRKSPAADGRIHLRSTTSPDPLQSLAYNSPNTSRRNSPTTSSRTRRNSHETSEESRLLALEEKEMAESFKPKKRRKSKDQLKNQQKEQQKISKVENSPASSVGKSPEMKVKKTEKNTDKNLKNLENKKQFEKDEQEIDPEMPDENLETESIVFIEVGNENCHGVLFLRNNQKVAMIGYANLTVLCGAVEANGYTLEERGRSVNVFSPETSSLQYVCDVSSAPALVGTRKRVEKALGALCTAGVSAILVDDRPLYSCVLVEKLSDLHSHMYARATEMPEKPRFLGEPFTHMTLNTSGWTHIADKLKENSHVSHNSILLCGGKDVGKSSFSRYLINKLLSKHESVFYLECDCGQTEFTPPAVLSLVKVDRPLLGPPASHPRKPEKAYFYGHVSPKDTPTTYIRTIERLYTWYVQHCVEEGPLVVNTQGWVKGLGLSLLVDCCRVVSPSVVVQFQSREFDTRNPPAVLSDDFLRQHPGWCIHPQHDSLGTTTGEYILLETQHKESQAKKSKSWHSRNLAINTYLTRLYEESFAKNSESNTSLFSSTFLSNLLPYKVPWNTVSLHVMHTNVSFDVILHTFNLSLVCLAMVDTNIIVPKDGKTFKHPNKLSETPSEAEYLGLGIVRNIDVEKGVFYILTPEPSEVVHKVNALLKGNIQLPAEYLMQDALGNHPYYCNEYINVTSKVSSALKPRFNLKRRPSRNKNTFGEK